MDNNIQTVLLQISEELREKEVLGMIFLSGKHLKEGEKEHMKDGILLFSNLKKKGLISKDCLLFVEELLIRIGRKDILRDVLKTTQPKMEELERSFRYISEYRSLLYEISVSLCTGETERIIFLLDDEIKYTCKLNEAKCMLVVLSEMEKQEKLSEDNLQILNSYLVNIGRPDLSKKIKKFEKEQRNRSLNFDAKFEKMAIKEESDNDVNVSSILPDVQNDPLVKNKLEEYKLDKIPHGLCIIVNNHHFKADGMKDRDGTQKDAEVIERVFRSRNYEVMQHNDLTGKEILNIMKNYAKVDHSEKDSFVCFILSHGEKGIVQGIDGTDVSVKDLTNCFNGQKCPSLVGKPKIFFIQACQGDKSDLGVPYVSDSNTSMYVNDGKTLPVSADFLTAFASVEEYESLRNPATGSVYIQTLCAVLQDHQFFKTDLISILIKVHNKIADEDYLVKKNGGLLKVKQMPSYHSELRKTLILPLPSNGQPVN
ncbi:caspase-8-like [Hyla sarda]|uniref:caspase-8-like n=1 Tax=Hyla sarda TaxID=327740 RepID=UPI0024C41993|nr:caspase-8-like [Hyla sarda]